MNMWNLLREQQSTVHMKTAIATWRNAVDFANSLLINNEPGTFLDEEYDFLKQIAKHFKDEQ